MVTVPERPEVGIALVYPDLLGTYGDSGNAVVLAQRLRWRGIPAEVVVARAGEAVPEHCELYVIGGGEDLPQTLAAKQLNAGRWLHRAVDRGAGVLAVCAGLQILGNSFSATDGRICDGLGLIDCDTRPGPGRRAVGELVVEADAGTLTQLSGYENHGGWTRLGPSARPLGRVLSGTGNGDGTDGVVSGRIWATYLHGPVLARNSQLADHVLVSIVGTLADLDDRESEELRHERLQRAGHAGSSRNGPRIGPLSGSQIRGMLSGLQRRMRRATVRGRK